MRYLTDGKRHLICIPYSVENLHRMAEDLSIKRCWFHSNPYPHYDIPKRMLSEVESKCEFIRPRDIVLIAKGEAMTLKHLEHFTPYQINNMETLEAFLRSDKVPPPQFDIGQYLDVSNVPLEVKRTANISFFRTRVYADCATPEVYNTCGTTACAIGHGPLAGIPFLDGETWEEYAGRVFGVCSSGDGYDVWAFMFGPGWTAVNNTAIGTSARIRWFLKDGVPAAFDADYVLNYGFKEFPWLDGVNVDAV